MVERLVERYTCGHVSWQILNSTYRHRLANFWNHRVLRLYSFVAQLLAWKKKRNWYWLLLSPQQQGTIMLRLRRKVYTGANLWLYYCDIEYLNMVTVPILIPFHCFWLVTWWLAPEDKSGGTSVFTPASTIGTHYRKCKRVLMATTTQSSYSIGKPLNLTSHNSGRTIPQFLTQLQLGTTPSDRYKCNRRVKWRSISPPLLLKFTMEVETIFIVIKLDPGLLIPAGQLLQWVLSNWNTHENKEFYSIKTVFQKLSVHRLPHGLLNVL